MAQKSIAFVVASAIALLAASGSAFAQPREAKPQAKVKTAPLAATGQTTSYGAGDDGDVRAGIAPPNPRFNDNGDGTVTDRLTTLQWTKDGAEYRSYWMDALAVCNAYSAGTLVDWRLPNVKELLSILDFEQKSPMLPVGHPFSNIQDTYYWSSTTNSFYDNHNDAYVVHLGTGEIRIWNKGGGGNVLCVRG